MRIVILCFLGVLAGCGQEKNSTYPPTFAAGAKKGVIPLIKKLAKKTPKKVKVRSPQSDAEVYYSVHFDLLKPDRFNNINPKVAKRLIEEGKLTPLELERIQKGAKETYKLLGNKYDYGDVQAPWGGDDTIIENNVHFRKLLAKKPIESFKTRQLMKYDIWNDVSKEDRKIILDELGRRDKLEEQAKRLAAMGKSGKSELKAIRREMKKWGEKKGY